MSVDAFTPDLNAGLQFLQSNPPVISDALAGGDLPKPATEAEPAKPAEPAKQAEPAKVAEPEKQVEPKPDADAARRLREAAQRDRTFREKEAKLKADLEAKQKALDERASKLKDLEDALTSKDPDKALKLMGLTYEDLATFKLNGKLPEQKLVEPLKNELESVKKEIADYKAQQEKAQQEGQVKAFKHQVARLVQASQGEDFELVRTYYKPEEAAETVYSTLAEFHQAGQEPPTVVEILKTMEAAEEKRLEAIAKTAKFSKKFAPAKPPEQTKPAPKTEEKPKPPPVSNAGSTETGTKIEEMDRDQLLAHVAANFKIIKDD